MENTIQYLRLIESKWMPFLSGMVFLWIFYCVYFIWGIKIPLEISSYKVSDFAEKFWVFIPFIYTVLSVIILYFLYFIKWIIRLYFWAINLFFLLLIFWFHLFFSIQLVYYEPRYTDVSIFIIDSFGVSMMYASFGTIFIILASIFIKRKL